MFGGAGVKGISGDIVTTAKQAEVLLRNYRKSDVLANRTIACSRDWLLGHACFEANRLAVAVPLVPDFFVVHGIH